MKRMLIVAGLVGLALAPISSPANADVPPPSPDPKPPMTREVPFKITADRTTKENRLIIPRKFLDKAKAVSRSESSLVPLDLRTVMAGLAISMSVVSLAFLLIRKKSRAAQAAMLFVALGGAGFLWMNQASADIAPPINEIPSVWRRVADSQKNVTIEIAEKGDAVELVIGTYYRSPSLELRERRREQDPTKAPPTSAPEPKSEKRPE